MRTANRWFESEWWRMNGELMIKTSVQTREQYKLITCMLHVQYIRHAPGHATCIYNCSYIDIYTQGDRSFCTFSKFMENNQYY